MRLAYQKVNPSGIPASEYTELEYLESSGTQYIDTGITSQNGTLKVVTNAKYTNTGVRQLMGYSAGAGQCIDCTVDGLLGLGSTYTLPNTISPFNWNIITYTINKYPSTSSEGYSSSLTVGNDSTIRVGGTPTNVPANGFTLFAVKSAQTTYDNLTCSMQMKYCQIYDNNELIRNFIPAKRNSDNVLGMYDTVTKSFFTNVGSGTFTAGDVVEKVAKPLIAHTNKIPSTYQELQYISSSGTQYIQSDLSMPDGFHAKGKVLFSKVGITQGVFGAYDYNGSYIDRNFIDATSVNWLIGYGGGGYQYFGGAPVANKEYTIDVSNITGKESLLINGTSYTVSVTGSVGTKSSTKLPIMALYTGDTSKVDYFMYGRMYYLKVYDKDEVLVGNFIPAKRKSDNVIGMYDSVTNSFYENAGTGTFTAGPEVHKVRLMNFEPYPSYIKPVEYLQSETTQYINTGIVPTETTKVYLDFIGTEYVAFGTVSGAHSGTDTFSHDFYPITARSDEVTIKTTLWLQDDSGSSTGTHNYSGTMLTRHKVLFNDNKQMYDNGTLIYTFTSTLSIPENPIFLFRTSGWDSRGGYQLPCKMYSCKIWDNGTLVRDFIPAINRANNNKPCMFDLVSQTPFYNVGSGEFITP